jgi:hypothetical protein
MTAQGMESVVDRGSVLPLDVVTNVSQIPNVIQIIIVARRLTQRTVGETLVVLEAVLARYVARARTAGHQVNAVFLTNVLIVVVRDVVQIQTVVQDIIVVRKGSGMRLASAALIVSENLVVQAMTVVAQASLVTRITDVRRCICHHG